MVDDAWKVMSTLLEVNAVEEIIKVQSKPTETIFKSPICHGHILKPKNILKHRCNKALKRKLCKYKLRSDGKEDPAVLDVSHSLLSSLKIRSPNNQTSPQNKSEYEDLRPKNYLFKMARKKLKLKPVEKSPKETDIESVSPLNGSQQKKTNAFKLLMDSRNKSIGTNSPGKEKSVDECETKEVKEKKHNKAKRQLVLQKMAEAKGSNKNKLMEEAQDKLIQIKMEKRAERLKSMIIKKKPKHFAIEKSVSELPTSEIEDKNVKVSDKVKKTNGVVSQPKSLQLINIFSDEVKPIRPKSPEKAFIPKEDEEFLKKLSPSIRKKENMLCYFRKVEKKPEETNVENGLSEDDNVPIIKVKVPVKIKKRKKKKLSLNKEVSNDVLKDHNEKSLPEIDAENIEHNSEIVDSCANSYERKKWKRKENFVNREKAIETIDMTDIEQRRSKRSVKRPIKYIDDVLFSSSEEELHIFTPKKRKHDEKKNKHKTNDLVVETVNLSEEETVNKVKTKKLKTKKKEIKTEKKAAKLAPIFAVKPQINPEELEAKQKFLYSGVPDKLKKIIAQQNNVKMELSNNFHSVVHVQQIGEPRVHTTVQSLIEHVESDLDEEAYWENKKIIYKCLLTMSKPKDTNCIIPMTKNNNQAQLKIIKELYPKFPVYRTYRLLKNKRKGQYKDYACPDFDNSIEIINGMADIISENPDSLNWTDKYRPLTTKQLIGNFESIKELKKWLAAWKENRMISKYATSDSSDFCESDADSRDSIKTSNNLFILTGPVGSGKTCCVYAVAAELAIKVIEVNASSKRTGKVMLQDLQEATQSHKVNRGKDSTENSQSSSQFQEIINNVKKRGRPKKLCQSTTKTSQSSEKLEMASQPTASQEIVRTGMSLILIDDADIVFDQDDGFSSAISQLVQSSKRPVILVTSSLVCPHLQRFLQYGKIMNMRPFLPRMLGTWLDIMCLADNGTCWPGLGAKFLNYFGGDIRRTINSLQFFITSNSEIAILPEEGTSQGSDYKMNIDEENSRMSWGDPEEKREKTVVSRQVDNEGWNLFMEKQSNLLECNSFDLFNVWWSVPNLLSEKHECEAASNTETVKNRQDVHSKLDAAAKVLEMLSVSDYYSHINPDTKCNLFSEPWYTSESDSVSESECLDQYFKSHEVSREISQLLVSRSVVEAQKSYQSESREIHFPGMAEQRERDRIVSRHNSLTEYLNTSSTLDRRGLALDYWPCCRAICRIEKNKTDTLSKRNNRFCHYLKSLNGLGNDALDKLGDSLFSNGKKMY